MSAHETANRTHCQNCGSPLTGPFCSECGQHDVDYHRSIGPVIEDALEGFLHFDGKFFKSVRYIFTRPGFLTNEFIAGRRVSYAHPVRFYIFASFLFFAVHVLTGQNPAAGPGASGAGAVEPKAIQAQRPAVFQPAAKETGAVANAAAGEPEKHGWLVRTFGLDGKLDRKALGREISHLFPSMLFLCLPLLAAALKLAYRSGGRYYIEHLIFALHVQAFVFLAALVDDIGEALLRLAGMRDPSFVGFLTFCGAAWLVYRSFRVVYGQGRAKTLLKVTLVGCAYGVILLMGMVMVALASAFIVKRGG